VLQGELESSAVIRVINEGLHSHSHTFLTVVPNIEDRTFKKAFI